MVSEDSVHQDEYHDAMVQLLELIWGAGYMAPGGPGNVTKMLSGLPAHGAKILDIGCGLGGPAREMARQFEADVIGIDLEAALLERARQDAEADGLADRCFFHQVQVGALPFEDRTFDIVVSAGALTQTEDKIAMLGEVFRVLKPGGWVSLYDWMKSPGEYSDAMRYWFKMEGLTYAMVTLEEQDALLRSAGFEAVATEDATAWYRSEASAEYQRICGELYPAVVERLGPESADHFVENWRAMVTVIDGGEMRQVYSRGRKPG